MRYKYDTAVFVHSVLTNGIPVFMQRPPILTDESARITAVLPHVGSCADPPDAHGTAHFFEHSPFQGTPSFPSTEQLLGECLAEGGEISADVSAARTRFYVDDALQFIESRIRCLGEMVTAPLLETRGLVAERAVIAQEYDDRFRMPKQVYERHFRRLFFGSHPYGHLPIGELATIQTMTADALRGFYAAHYHAGNLAIVCSGNLPPDPWLLETLEFWFGRLPSRDPFGVPPPPVPNGAEHVVNDQFLGKDSLRVYYPMAKPSQRQQHAWMMLAACLGGAPDAPLGKELRLNRRWAYNTRMARFRTERHLATFEYKFQLMRDRFAETLKIAGELLANLTDKDFAKYQHRLQGSRCNTTVHHRETNERLFSALVRGEEPISLNETAALQDSIEWPDIVACRDQLFQIKPFIIRALAH